MATVTPGLDVAGPKTLDPTMEKANPDSSTSTSTGAASSSSSKKTLTSSDAAECAFAPSTWSCLPVDKREWLKQLDPIMERFVWRLRRREVSGSTEWALQTMELLRAIIVCEVKITVQECLDLLRHVGKVLTAARPIDLVIGNIVRRVLFIVRKNCAAHSKRVNANSASSTPLNLPAHIGASVAEAGKRAAVGDVEQVDMSVSLYNMFAASSIDTAISLDTIKPQILDDFFELDQEIRLSNELIAEQSKSHIYANEVIITFGYSRTVLSFLTKVRKRREFDVYVVESAPGLLGHKMAVKLAEAGVSTTVITDAAVFAVMPSVSKVIIGTQAVLANGGILAQSGTANVLWAAKHHATPVVVLTGLHKLCPLYAFDQDTFNEHNPPSQIIEYDKVLEGKVDVINPAFDYVEPDLISLFITNFDGNQHGNQPSYMYRLISEYYDLQDYNF